MSRSSGRQARAPLVLGLTVVSAATDAISYVGLGHVFPANMTGNSVLLGIGLATADLGAAAPAGAARYGLIALAGAAWAPRARWSAR